MIEGDQELHCGPLEPHLRRIVSLIKTQTGVNFRITNNRSNCEKDCALGQVPQERDNHDLQKYMWVSPCHARNSGQPSLIWEST